MKLRHLGGVLLLLVLAVTASGCESCKGKTSGRTRVAVSIFPIYDVTRRIAGPDADVSLVLPPGHTEHTFDPTPKDVEEISEAKLGVMIGLGLDPWMEKLLKDAAPTAATIKGGELVPTLTVTQDAVGDEAAHRTVPEDDHDHDKGAPDPHLWLDPARVRTMAKVDRAHAAGYHARAVAVDSSLASLDEDVKKQTAAWKTRGFVTFHGSFGYFAKHYGLQILAVIEPFPGSSIAEAGRSCSVPSTRWAARRRRTATRS